MNFEVKTFYKALVCHEAVNFPWNGVWRVKALKWWRSLFGQCFRKDFNSRQFT
jgi:hypothetical protein